MIVDIILTLIIIALGIWVYLSKTQVVALKLDKEATVERYKQMAEENEVLTSYTGNEHIVWSKTFGTFFDQPPLDENKRTVVLIRLEDFCHLYQSRWRNGYNTAEVEYSKRIRMHYMTDAEQKDEADNNVVQLRTPFSDKRFDNDFAKFVNSLTQIAIRYGKTQQLRERISYLVTDYRLYLSKKQKGEKVSFPSDID